MKQRWGDWVEEYVLVSRNKSVGMSNQGLVSLECLHHNLSFPVGQSKNAPSSISYCIGYLYTPL